MRSLRTIRIFSRNILILFCAAFFASSLLSEPAYATPKKSAPKAAAKQPKVVVAASPTSPECKASLLLDPESGEPLMETNAHESLPPASMVKLMLAYVVMHQVAEHRASLDDQVNISGHCSKIGGSQVYLKQGEQFTLNDLLDAVLIQSANDAAVAIAEHIGGTSEGFVELMNAQAQNLGMKESEFHSPHGLPPGKDQLPDRVSANDFGILARALVKEFPQILDRTGKTETGFRGGEFKMTNHNHLLQSFPGCDGLKTGYYGEAGFSIAATAKRNDQRLIAVVMGCKERKKRDAEAARLLSLGFAQFRPTDIVLKGVAVGASVPVTGGTVASVIPITGEKLSVALKSNEAQAVEKRIDACSSLQAPVAANTRCGSVTFTLHDRKLGSVPLVVAEQVPAGGIVSTIKSSIGW